MELIISNTSSVPIYKQIYSQIVNLIVRKSLKKDTPLPSMRFLAKELRVSLITTRREYEDLEKNILIGINLQ